MTIKVLFGSCPIYPDPIWILPHLSWSYLGLAPFIQTNWIRLGTEYIRSLMTWHSTNAFVLCIPHCKPALSLSLTHCRHWYIKKQDGDMVRKSFLPFLFSFIGHNSLFSPGHRSVFNLRFQSLFLFISLQDYLKNVVPSVLIKERGSNLVVINPG